MSETVSRNSFLSDQEARAVVLAWAESGGFAAVHGTGATPEAIADDLLAFLSTRGFRIARETVSRNCFSREEEMYLRRDALQAALNFKVASDDDVIRIAAKIEAYLRGDAPAL